MVSALFQYFVFLFTFLNRPINPVPLISYLSNKICPTSCIWFIRYESSLLKASLKRNPILFGFTIDHGRQHLYLENNPSPFPRIPSSSVASIRTTTDCSPSISVFLHSSPALQPGDIHLKNCVATGRGLSAAGEPCNLLEARKVHFTLNTIPGRYKEKYQSVVS